MVSHVDIVPRAATASRERLMRCRIGTAVAAFVIFIGSSIVSLAAETGGAPSSGEKGGGRLTFCGGHWQY
jgi:hypothetical protein